jgi:hypothetical protein
MSLRSQTHRTLIGAAGAAALAVGAIASPALAAGSTASATYTCTTQFGPAHPSADYSVKSAPAKMAVGQPVSTTAKFTLDAATTALATTGLGWSKFTGTITTAPSASKAGLDLKFPKTTLGNGTGGSTVANAKGSTLAGAKVGKFTFKLGDLGKVKLTGFDASGKKVGSVVFPTKGTTGKCKNDAGSTTLKSGATAVTTKVVKDSTKTNESASYSSKKNKANGTAKVKAKYGTAATGKVKFLLKKGSTTVKSAKSKLNKKGIAKVSFKGVTAKGKYSIVGKYAGSKTLKGSSGKASFTVK